MKTVFRDRPDGAHELQPVLDDIERAISTSSTEPCKTEYCYPCNMELGIYDKNVCDSCKVHWLLEAAAEVAHEAIRKDRPQ